MSARLVDEFTHVENTVQFYLNCNRSGGVRRQGRQLGGQSGRAVPNWPGRPQEAEEQAAEEQSEQAELQDTDNAPGVPGE